MTKKHPNKKKKLTPTEGSTQIHKRTIQSPVTVILIPLGIVRAFHGNMTTIMKRTPTSSPQILYGLTPMTKKRENITNSKVKESSPGSNTGPQCRINTLSLYTSRKHSGRGSSYSSSHPHLRSRTQAGKSFKLIRQSAPERDLAASPSGCSTG